MILRKRKLKTQIASDFEECLVCASPVSPRNGIEDTVKVEQEARIIFLLRKLLGISSSICADFLAEGNPSTWFSYCLKCKENVIKAEKTFLDLIHLENKLKCFTKSLEKQTYECYYGSTGIADQNSITYRIRKEVVNRIQLNDPTLPEATSSTGAVHSILDSEIKIEDDYGSNIRIENEGDYDSNDFESTDIFANWDNQEETNNDEEESQEESVQSPKSLKKSNANPKRGRSSPRIKSLRTTVRNQSKKKSSSNLSSVRNVPYPCIHCDKGYRTFRLLFAHNQKLHNGPLGHLELRPFACQHCLHAFSKESRLDWHVLTEHSDINFGIECPDCGVKFRNNATFIRHANVIHQKQLKLYDDRGLECLQCKRVFRSPQGRRFHERRYHEMGQKNFPCGQCGMKFIGFCEFRKHYSKFHSGSLNSIMSNSSNTDSQEDIMENNGNVKKCPSEKDVSAEKSKTDTLNIEHRRTNVGNIKMKRKCHYCQRTFMTTEGRIVHERRVHPYGDDLPLTCANCDENFATLETFTRHNIENHDGEEFMLEKPFQCQICTFGFLADVNLQKHKIQSHDEPAECVKCGKSFRGIHGYQRHEMTAHLKESDGSDGDGHTNDGPIEENAVSDDSTDAKSKNTNSECIRGQQSFKTQSSYTSLKNKALRLTAKIRKNKVTPASCSKVKLEDKKMLYPCKYCPKRYAIFQALLKHHKAHHKGPLGPLAPRPFGCQQCPYAFTKESQLDWHILTEHSNAAFGVQCPDCDEKFRSNAVYINHAATVHQKHLALHEGDSLECLYCKQNFSTSEERYNHEQQYHPAEKSNFPCGVCGVKLRGYVELRRHMKNFHCTSLRTSLLKSKNHLDHTENGNGQTECTGNILSENLARVKNAEDGFPKELDTQSTPVDGLQVKCRFCSQMFASNIGRRVHEGAAHAYGGDMPLTCAKCSQSFTDLESFVDHCAKNHNGEECLTKKPFQCQDCVFGFATETNLQKHRFQIHREKPFCSHCQKSFQTIYQYQKHIISVHRQESCEIVGDEQLPKAMQSVDGGISSQKTKKDKQLPAFKRSRREINEDLKTVRCHHCRMPFADLEELKTHKLQRHPHVLDPPLVCNKCEEGFFNAESFTNHCALNHNGEEGRKAKPFQCSKCCFGFFQETNLLQHVFKIHGQLSECPECHKLYYGPRKLAEHIKVVHRKERNHTCHICGKSFSFNDQLQNHILSQHERSDKLKCPECDHIGSSKNSLRHHITVIHEKNFKFRCPICNSGFTCKSATERHIMLTHTNQRPYKCTECDKSYAVKHEVKVHMRTHTGEKPFQCSICTKSFHLKKRLTRHALNHTTEKRFKCDVCEKRFPSGHYLRSHIYATHRQKKKYPKQKKVLDEQGFKEVISQLSDVRTESNCVMD